jgi:hypothetical protein
MRHFAVLGRRQIQARYYDGPPERIGPWLTDAAQAAASWA